MIDIDEPEYAANGCEFDEDLLGITAIECKSIASELRRLESMNKELLAALEWSDAQIMEFISIAFRHAQIRGDFELSDVRDALNMITSKAKAAS